MCVPEIQMLRSFNIIYLVLSIQIIFAAPSPWDKYNYSPTNRTVLPTNLYKSKTLINFPIQLNGTGSDVVFDFGKEVGGYTTIEFGTVTGTPSVTFYWSESSLYIQNGDDSKGSKGPAGTDGGLNSGPLTTNSNWTASGGDLRGGFRYLRVVINTNEDNSNFNNPDTTTVSITGVTLHFTAAPHIKDLRAYKSHFMSSDDLVNKIWYAAAYTTQLCSISASHGRQWPPSKASGWSNNASCISPSGTGLTVLVDGAKRDRTIWPGDMGVSTATAFATTGDTYSSRISLETLYAYQSKDGMLPYAGPPVDFFDNSDTYHLWALIGTCNLFSHTHNVSWLQQYWTGYQRGVNASVLKINGDSGLMVVDKTADWQRCCQGGENIAANALLYNVLNKGSKMAAALGDNDVAATYKKQALALKTAINNQLWDDSFGAFKDNPTSSLHPQDGNSLANWFGITSNYPNRSLSISNYLKSNWGKYGSASPEWNNGQSIGTFPGSMEVFGHFAVGQGERALDLIRLQWGYMLHSKISTESTFWEGYNVDGTFNFGGSYMSHAHGWGSGPGGALTESILGIRADIRANDATNNDDLVTSPTSFVIAPQPSGLDWCEGRLSFADNHNVDVQWNKTNDMFTLVLNLEHTHPNAIGRIELPLFHGDIEIEIDGIVVTKRTVSVKEFRPIHSIILSIPLRSHIYVVRRKKLAEIVNSPFPKSIQPTTHLFAISEQQRSNVELLCLDSLSGYLARTTPQLYRVANSSWKNNSQDSYSIWLTQMMTTNNSVQVDDSLLTASLVDIVHKFIATEETVSYLFCNSSDESVSVAITLAAASDTLLLIAGDRVTATALESIGIVMSRDLHGTTVDEEITIDVLKKLSKEVFIFQNPSKSQFLADWSIFARASNMIWNTKNVAQNVTLNRVTTFGAAFGWGPENDYVTTLNSHGVWVHASDYNKNFPALSNYVAPSTTATATATLSIPTSTDNNKHTVAFLMTDGDNLQWTLGPWSTSSSWYGSKLRGSFPMGWTLSPAIADLAPAAMNHILSQQTQRDELVAGPSGYGYMYPTTLPASNRSSFAATTSNAMHTFGMSTINVLGQNDDPPNCDELSELMNTLKYGMTFYSWGDGYSGLKGKIYYCNKKPIVTGRWSLWGNNTDVQQDMVGVQAMIAKLLALKDENDSASPNSYTLIPVHAWSHTLKDVSEIVAALPNEKFDIVLPSEMLNRIKNNVEGIQID